MAALIIGVIVAGLGIGALISAFQNRGTLPELGATSVPAVTPVPQPSAPPPLITPAPSPSPTASPVPTPSPKPKPSPTAAPATPAATPAPTPAPVTITAAPAVSASLPPRPPPTAPPSRAPAAIAPPNPPPAAVRPPVPAGSALPSYARPLPAATPGDTAVALVRRYLTDLMAGDEAGAYAALGGSAGDRSLDLKEEAFLDKDARITSIRVTHSDGSGATVDAEITSDHGSYATTFHVTYGPNGSIIDKHDFIKI